jgi:hypothetical protein
MELEGWVTSVDPATETIQIEGQTVSTKGLRIIGGILEPGAYVSADHGANFTAQHGDVVEKIGRKPCLPCHAQDWGRRDRQALTELLTANPSDIPAAHVIGPNNFCVYCHRTDTEWLEQ